MKFENLEKAKAICIKIGELRTQQEEQSKIQSIVLSDSDENCILEIFPKKSFEEISVEDIVGLAAYNLISAIKMETDAKLVDLHNQLLITQLLPYTKGRTRVCRIVYY